MTKPLCPYFGECGGCDLQNISYEEQIEFKKNHFQKLLQKHQLPSLDVDFIKSPKDYFYRNRIQLHVQNKVVGFFKKKSHDLVAIDECKISRPEINEAITHLLESSELKKVSKVEIYVDDKGSTHKSFDKKTGTETGFHQVNPEINEQIKIKIKEELQKPKNILELYAGTGNLTESYYSKKKKIIAVESHLHQGNFFKKDNVFWDFNPVDSFLKKTDISHFDACLADPPRGGLSGLTLKKLQDIPKLVLLFCEPEAATGALKQLLKTHEIKSTTIYDMFPQTHDYETLLILEKIT